MSKDGDDTGEVILLNMCVVLSQDWFKKYVCHSTVVWSNMGTWCIFSERGSGDVSILICNFQLSAGR